MKKRSALVVVAATVSTIGILVGSTSAGSFIATVDGSPPSPAPAANSSLADWDVQVHSRNPETWFALDPIQAQHGSDCAGPPAMHVNSSYEGAVFQCRDHLMTAINADAYGMIYLTPNQLFDFASGGVVSFDISTERMSTRDWWDLWITPWEDNLALPFDLGDVDLQGPPRNAIHISIENAESSPVLTIYRNGVATTMNTGFSTPSTRDGIAGGTNEAATRQPFKLTIGSGRIKFERTTSTSAVATTFFDVAATPNFNRGIVQFGHHSYTPTKDGAGVPATWHWDNFSINPATPFTIIKASQRYVTSPSQTVAFSQGAPANSFLRFSGIGTIEVALDGGAYQPAAKAIPAGLPTGYHAEHMSNYWMPVPAGTKNVKLRFSADSWYAGPYIAKDFALFATAGSIPSTATPTRTATPTTVPSGTPAPTATPGTGSAAITGTVTVEGRATSAGVEVSASPGGHKTTTDTNGNFLLTGLQTNSTYTLTASLEGFVDVRRLNLQLSSGTSQLGSVVIRAGDIDGDNAVTVTDVSLVAGLYGNPAGGSIADLNANGLIDVSDVSLAAGNYGLTGPLEW